MSGDQSKAPAGRSANGVDLPCSALDSLQLLKNEVDRRIKLRDECLPSVLAYLARSPTRCTQAKRFEVER